MGLINYEQLEDGFDASANLWNERFGILFNEINGNLDAANLKNGAVTTPKLANGSVTSEKLGLVKYIDNNGWTITDLGLVKLATKRKPFTIASTAVGGSTFGVYSTGINNLPEDFDENAPYNVMHSVYMLGTTYPVGPWDLKVKEEDGVGFLKPDTPVVGTRLNTGTSAASEPGAHETWIIY